MKIGPVVLAEKILIEIALCFHVVVRRIFGHTEPNFAIFSPYECALRANDGYVLYFPIFKGRCHGNQIMLPKWRQTDTMCILCTFARWLHGFVLLLLATNATISCKILVKIGPVVSTENILIEIALCVHVVVRRMSSNISGWTGPIFAIISQYESPLHADMDLYLILRFVMKVNWYYVHSLQFARWSTVLFRYYLLGGDTVGPSGLLARLFHAFLVFFLFQWGRTFRTVTFGAQYSYHKGLK